MQYDNEENQMSEADPVANLGAKVQRGSSLVSAVAQRFAQQIAAGKLKPGDQLPTEREIMLAMGVSRTVVREAVAQLRADGLVSTRQGIPAFVSEGAHIRPFKVDLENDTALNNLRELMELRCAIEVEAVRFACARATPQQLDDIEQRLEEIEAAIGRNEAAVPQDLGFHRQIAMSTGNPQFPRILDYLGQFIIPRLLISRPKDAQKQYLATIQMEHRNILEALRRRDADGAATAMRAHLERNRTKIS